MNFTITEPPFHRRINPSEPDVRSEVVAWLSAWGCPSASVERVGRADVARIASLTHPDASPVVLEFATRLWAFAILLDDELDAHGRPAEVIEAIMGVLAGPTPLRTAYQEIQRSVADLGDNAAWRRTLLGHLSDALGGKRFERRAREATTIEEYLARRRAASFGDALVDLIELPAAAAPTVPEYRRLVRDTLDAARIINDILSAHKELAEEQDPINIVTLVRATPREPLPTAIARVDDLLRTVLRRMIRDRLAMLEMSQSDPVIAGALERCADGCGAFIRGVFDWHLEVARYRDPDITWQIRWLDHEPRRPADEQTIG